MDHAGEYGAIRIYEGQKKALKHDPCFPTIAHMAEQEQEHLSFFETSMRQHHIRPTVFLPLWHGGGWLMGYITGRMNKHAAMACTVGVEEIIDAHYSEQLDLLPHMGESSIIVETIEKFRQEECEHRDIALDYQPQSSRSFSWIKNVVGLITKTAITLSKRI